MADRKVDVLILTGQASFEYFTGYRSEFWASTTRPFYGVIVPDRSEGTVIIHQSEQRSTPFDIAGNNFIFYELFLTDGLKALRETVAKFAPSARKIAVDFGDDLVGRGSLVLESMLRDLPSHPTMVEGAEMIWAVRAIKSEYEIEMKRRACDIAPQSFFEALKTLKLGQNPRMTSPARSKRLCSRRAPTRWISCLCVSENRSSHICGRRPTNVCKKTTTFGSTWVALLTATIRISIVSPRPAPLPTRNRLPIASSASSRSISRRP